MFSPRLTKSQPHQVISLSLFSTTAALSIGFYDGFFGPGTGSFFTIAFVALLGFSMTRATAHAKVLNCTSNLASLIFFMMGGHVVWEIGLIMMLGQAIGARLGSTMVLKKGEVLIRPLIICVSLLMAVKLLWGNYGYLIQ